VNVIIPTWVDPKAFLGPCSTEQEQKTKAARRGTRYAVPGKFREMPYHQAPWDAKILLLLIIQSIGFMFS
jgi:hypothetical protein